VKGECCTMRIVEVLISNGLPISSRFKIGRSMMYGVHSSPILRSWVVGHPSVEVDSPEDFEVVNSSEIPAILCPLTPNLQNPAF
jgi:hypothetical protein